MKYMVLTRDLNNHELYSYLLASNELFNSFQLKDLNNIENMPSEVMCYHQVFRGNFRRIYIYINHYS